VSHGVNHGKESHPANLGAAMPTAEFRFYEELNDFLPSPRRKRSFVHSFAGTPAVKDVIEGLGVPHTEVDLILVDGRSARFLNRLRGGERVAVYPMFERLDIRPLYRLRPKPLRRTRFLADVHLGKLARLLRLLGFDTRYSPGLSDPERQVQEVVQALSLQRSLQPFTRCMSCNQKLHAVPRAAVKDRVPSRVFKRFRRFVRCPGCARIYWRGTHFLRLEQLVRRMRTA